MESIIAGLLKEFEDGKMTRRQLIQSLALAASAAAAPDAIASRRFRRPSSRPDGRRSGSITSRMRFPTIARALRSIAT